MGDTERSDAARRRRRHTVAVIGDGEVDPGGRIERVAEDVGKALVDAGFRVLTGGGPGVMAAASRGAHRSGRYAPGDVVGLLPGDDVDEANPWVDVAIPTGLGHLRNGLVARCDAVIAIGGRSGTLSELAFAWTLGRLIVALRGDGWAGRLADTAIDDRVRYAHIDDDRVFGADDAVEAVAIVNARLPRYLSRC